MRYTSLVSLFAPRLRRRWWKVAIEIVEAQAGTAKQAEVSGTGSVTKHGEGWNGCEAHQPVWTELLDGIDVAGRHDLQGFFPVEAHKATESAYPLIAVALLLILHD